MPRGLVAGPCSQKVSAMHNPSGQQHYALIFPVAWLVTPYRKIVGEPGGGAAGCTCLAALINLSYKGRKVIDSDTDTVDSG